MIRLLPAIILFMMICFLPNAVSAEVGKEENWSQFRHNSINNPYLILMPSRLNDQKILTEDEIRSTPVVADGKLFVGNHDTGYLYAYDISYY